ncbi:hypothetical protein D3C85_1889800 [compost metagenome]
MLYQKGVDPSFEKMTYMYNSQSAEHEIESLQGEVDAELERLYEAMKSGDEKAADTSKEKLKKLRRGLMELEW